MCSMAKIHPGKRAYDLYRASGRPQGEIVNGIIIPSGGRKDLKDLQSRFLLRPSDVFLASYPKTGSTWLLQIVKLIRNNGMEDGRDVDQSIPLLEFMTPKEAEAIPSPRAFRSHVPYHLFVGGEPATTRGKYIYIYRNPKDTAVSLYHFSVGFQFAPSFSWDDFFELFIDGMSVYGSMLDHVQEWWKHRDAKNVLILNYKSMHKDLPGTIQTIADFLGYYLSPEIVRKITEQTTFATMKKNSAANNDYTDKYRHKKSTPFMRKGVVGDWRNHFTAEQSARMDEECAKRFAGSGLEFDYGPPSPSSKL